MGLNEQTQQQLWELIYGLLPDEDADALSARIRSEPDLARAYVTAKLQSDLLAEAARLDDATTRLQLPPTEQSAGSDPAHRPRTGSPQTAKRRRQLRVPSTLIGLAAVLSIGFVGYVLVQSDRLDPDSATANVAKNTAKVLTTVTMPAQLHRDITNTVIARTSTASGAPFDTTLEYRVYDQAGALQLKKIEKTGSDGTSRVELSGNELPETALLEVAPIAGLGKPLSAPSERVERKCVDLSDPR